MVLSTGAIENIGTVIGTDAIENIKYWYYYLYQGNTLYLYITNFMDYG